MKRMLFVLALLGSIVGCDSGPDMSAPKVFPVRGQVFYDGKPVEGVIVTLFPNDAPMIPSIPRNPHAITAADGTFSISTFGKDDGAAEGGYQVLLAYPKPEEKDVLERTTENDRFLGWYDAMRSTISVRIKPESNELAPFKIPLVTRPPDQALGVPGRN